MNDNLGLRKLSASSLKESFHSIPWSCKGRVTDVVGTLIEATLPNSHVGSIVSIKAPDRREAILAEVVGFRKERVLLLPYSHLQGVSPGSTIEHVKSFAEVPLGDHLLGRIIDPFLQTLDTGESLIREDLPTYNIDREAPNPIERERIEKALGLGIRAMDALLTFGEGQRIGIMAGSGVGKSVLMGMISKKSEADVNVIALIGERGREVREFIERDLGKEGLARSVLVVVTGDQSPLMRIRGAKLATSIAEYFSHSGRSVMLMIDSLTRVAMAQREIGNAVGEPPTTKGYTPSVFSLLPKLLERAGPQKKGHGAISGLYTVLVDGDDFNDPVADAVRSILDGHIVLTRELAIKGHFPAIDVSQSASRVMSDIVSPAHWQQTNYFRELLGTYNSALDMIQIGAYQPGTNPKLDEAIRLMPVMENFLKQGINESCTVDEATVGLRRVLMGQTHK
ncbi:MAG: FliI/YscN family ATPase [Chitinophagaceae bacterium]|nr:FliI/YscN family ATPase [Oligoflexus sp.]